MSNSRKLELPVDTGSIYTWVSGGLLEELGLEARTTRRFKAVDGRLLERRVSEAVIEYMGERATRMVVFATEKDAEVLGVDALEGLGLEVDPITIQLKKAEALLAL
jgi:predicted aspartyl protease